MTSLELFERLGPLVGPALQEVFDRRDLCIVSTRVAIEVARYFGVQATALPVKTVVYNRAFARHVADRFTGVDPKAVPTWGDGSWSVGIGYGKTPGKWSGHLIAVTSGCFGDFSIQQAERPQYDIITGPALVGPYRGQDVWSAIHQSTGTVIEYTVTTDNSWRTAPDWKDEKRRWPIVGKLIRTVRAMEAMTV